MSGNGNASRLFDMHTHFFGPVFFRTLAAAAHPQRDPGPGLERLTESGLVLPDPSPEAHARRWVAEMDRHGVERMVSFASLQDEAESTAQGAAAAGGRLLPFTVLDPSLPAMAERLPGLRRDLGMRGLVLFPAMHRFDPGSESLDPFYRAAAAEGFPLVVHVGRLEVRIRHLLGLRSEFTGDLARPDRLEPAVRRHPDLRFIIPHFGERHFAETLDLGARYPNVAVDTSSSNAWREAVPGLGLDTIFRRALEALGPERIYFGTDSSVFPRGWRVELYREQVAALEAAGASAGVRERILGGNARELFPPEARG